MAGGPLEGVKVVDLNPLGTHFALELANLLTDGRGGVTKFSRCCIN